MLSKYLKSDKNNAKIIATIIRRKTRTATAAAVILCIQKWADFHLMWLNSRMKIHTVLVLSNQKRTVCKARIYLYITLLCVWVVIFACFYKFLSFYAYNCRLENNVNFSIHIPNANERIVNSKVERISNQNRNIEIESESKKKKRDYIILLIAVKT